VKIAFLANKDFTLRIFETISSKLELNHETRIYISKKDTMLCKTGCPTVCVTRKWAGVDNV
jgi:hypothetical protein